MSRRIRYSVAMSLDGFIADKDGGYGWIPPGPDVDFGAFMSKIDTLIMGRGTYEVVRSQGEAGVGFDMETIVVSNTLTPSEHPKVSVVSGADVEAFVGELKAREGKDIWLFGGGVLFRSLLEAGLVDRVEVGVIPVLLGEGIPLLPGLGAGAAKLSLHSVEEFSTGTILLKYDVEGSSAPTAKRRGRRSGVAPAA
jgi:dihydrofolate reductase